MSKKTILNSFSDLGNLSKGDYNDNKGNRKLGRVGKHYGGQKEKDHKGHEEATKLLGELRSGLFRNMNDNQLHEFREVMARGLDLKM